ncbi:MAG: hypothetical protein ACP5RI_01090 [Candidatus Micrarchaeia archaeon]
MDLLAKVIIIIILLIVIAIIYYQVFAYKNNSNNQQTQSEAVKMVLSDIMNRTPNANISDINVLNYSKNKGWLITLMVAYNKTKPCPTLLSEMYYSNITLSPTNQTLVQNCKVFGYSNQSNYLVTMPEAAITISYDSSKYAKSFVNEYGYGNVNVYANFSSNLTSNTLKQIITGNILSIENQTVTNQSSAFNTLSTGLSDVWLIKYTAKNAPYSLYIEMTQYGKIINQFDINSI